MDVRAQGQITQSCNQGNELALVVPDGSQDQFQIYVWHLDDYLTGHPQAQPFYSYITPPDPGSGCAWQVETNWNPVCSGPLPSGGDEPCLPPNTPYVIDIQHETSSARSTFTYALCTTNPPVGNGYPAYDAETFGFYCPYEDNEPGQQHQDVDIRWDGSELDIDPFNVDMPDDTGVSELIADYFGSNEDHWVIPYDYDAICEALAADGDPINDCAAGEKGADYFISPQPGYDYTFAPTDLDLRAAWTWTWTDAAVETVRLQPGTQLIVDGDFDVEDVTFTASNATQGWYGIDFEPGSTGTLESATIETIDEVFFKPGAAAIEAYDATVTLTGTIVRDVVDGHGIWAADDAIVTVEQTSFVENTDDASIVTSGGADVSVFDSVVQDGQFTGAGATGMGSQLYLWKSTVQDQEGIGVASEAYGEVFLNRPGDATPDEGVIVDRNETGLHAQAAGYIEAGIYKDQADACSSACRNSLRNNWQGASFYDASSTGSSTLWAEFNRWGVGRTLNDIETDVDGSSLLEIAPLWDGTTSRTASYASRGGDGHGPLVEALEATYAARAEGDEPALATALQGALALAQTPEERGLAYGAAARILSHRSLPIVESYLQTRLTEGDPARPQALTALLATQLRQERPGDAEATADALVDDFPRTVHALAGWSALAHLAVARGDEQAALTALSALQSDWPGLLETEATAALVSRIADLPEGRMATTQQAVASRAAPTLARLHPAHPNPFNPQTVIGFTLEERAEVTLAVYDVLGREVTRLVDGVQESGSHQVTFDAAELASGLYLVRATIESVEGGSVQAFTQPITLLK